jgi:predicted ester cyclase
MTDDCEMTMPGAPAMRGLASIRATLEAWTRALPDLAPETIVAVEQGDVYAAETRFSGTHTGPMRTPQGELPPTKRRVTWQSADVVRVRGGKICAWHVYHDPVALFAQLGVAQG